MHVAECGRSAPVQQMLTPAEPAAAAVVPIPNVPVPLHPSRALYGTARAHPTTVLAQSTLLAPIALLHTRALLHSHTPPYRDHPVQPHSLRLLLYPPLLPPLPQVFL